MRRANRVERFDVSKMVGARWRRAGGYRALLPALVAICGAARGAKLPEGLSFTDITLRPALWHHGMVENRFLIENPTSRDRRLTLVQTVKGHSAGLEALSQTIVAGARSEIIASMPLPPMNAGGVPGAVRVSVGDARKTVDVDVPATSYSGSGYFSTLPLSILVSKSLSAEELKQKLSLISTNSTSRAYGYGLEEFNILVGKGSVSEVFSGRMLDRWQAFRYEGDGHLWPRDWRAYSAFDACLISAADFEDVPPDSGRALLRYARAGGRVYFMGRETLPAGWEEDLANGLVAGAAEVIEKPAIAALSVEEVTDLALACLRSARPLLRNASAGSSLAGSVPVAESTVIPVRSFLLILFLFSLCAGPLAIIFTARAGRRIMLLWIVPVFSLLFSFVIIGYALMSEGVTPMQRRQALTLLDQSTRSAVTFGAVGIYSPLALRDGLYFSSATEVSPLSKASRGVIRCGQSQHYASGWVQARIPSYFLLRRSEERSERLVVTFPESGAPEVVNALGGAILKLRLAAPDGAFFESGYLAPGEKGRLAPVEKAKGAESPAAFLARLYHDSGDGGWGIAGESAKLLGESAVWPEPAPYGYLAVLEGAPFLENPLSYCRSKDSERSIVIGRYHHDP